jgi:hypothetical protein
MPEFDEAGQIERRGRISVVALLVVCLAMAVLGQVIYSCIPFATTPAPQPAPANLAKATDALECCQRLQAIEERLAALESAASQKTTVTPIPAPTVRPTAVPGRTP